jgi:1-acyl-sn-glycerol-3-phosphate acyltransferase
MQVTQQELASSPCEAGHGKMYRLSRCYYVLAYVFYWAVLGASFFWGCVLAALLYPLMPRSTGMALGRRGISAVFAFILGLAQVLRIAKFDVSALDALHQEQRLILAPNHPCLLDVALVISRLPNVSCIMKAELWDSVFLGAGARLARYIRNDTVASMVRLAAEDVASGSLLLMFPEGTRTVVLPVNDFKAAGLALIAKRAQAPVQTLFIDTNTEFLGKAWPFYRLPDNFPVLYRVRLGQRFEVPTNVQDFNTQLHAYFVQALEKQTPHTASS